jgi:Uma2 family endonuclease
MAAPATQRRTRTMVPPRLALAKPFWVRVPASALTLDGFRAWATSKDFPQHVRAAFIDQEVFLEMSNEELETHVLVKGEIARVLMTLCRELKNGKFYPDGALITNKQARVSNNPDASFVARETLEAGRVQLIPRQGAEGQYIEMEGTPDWVLEVVSDSSVEKDTQTLRDAYHRAGIPEYWLVDARGEEISFQILYRRKSGYVAAADRGGWQRSRVFGRSFRLLRQRDDLDLWEYTLEVRAS